MPGQTWPRSGPDLAPIRPRSGPDRGQIWTRSGPNRFRTKPIQNHTDSEPNQFRTTPIQSNTDSEPHRFGTKPIQKGARWLGLNLLGELDAPSEYWLDRKHGDLYFIAPPQTEAAGSFPGGRESRSESDLVVSVNSTALESNASHVRFVGIAVMYSQGNGMVLQGDHITVINCSSSHHGAIGLVITGSGNTVRGSVVHDVGCAALVVESGDRSENASFAPFCTKNDHLTKTGSG